MKYILSFLFCSFFLQLSAQKNYLNIFNKGIEPIDLHGQNWIKWLNSKDKTDFSIEKVKDGQTCIYRFYSESDSIFLTKTSDCLESDSVVLMPILAKFFAEKMQNLNLQYDVADELEPVFHRKGKLKEFWVFGLSGEFEYSKRASIQTFPYNKPVDAIREKYLEYGGESNRFTENSRFYIRCNYTPDNYSGTRKKETYFSQGFVTRIYGGFAVGYSLRRRSYFDIFDNKSSQINFNPILEYNFFPLKKFYRKQLTLQYRPDGFFWTQFNDVLTKRFDTFKDLSHNLSLRYYSGTSKRYFSANLSESISKYLTRNTNTTALTVEYGVNLGRHIWLQPELLMIYSVNNNLLTSTKSWNLEYYSSLKLAYYFGANGRNIINPQVY